MRISIVYQPKRLNAINQENSGTSEDQKRREIAGVGSTKRFQIAFPHLVGMLQIVGAPTESWSAQINQH